MNYHLLLLLLCATVYSSPLSSHEESTHRGSSEDDRETTTHPTFTVQRLDAPIERIEIRLIDENPTHPKAQEITESNGTDGVEERKVVAQEPSDVEVTTTTDQPQEHFHQPDQDPSPAPTELSIPTETSSDDMYKRTEYEVQPTAGEIPPMPPTDPVFPSSAEPIVIGEDPSYFSTVSSDKQASAEAKAWISVSATIPKFEGDIDEDDLPPPPAVEDAENEEPEEECLANKEKLSEDVVERLRAETTTYYRLVRQRNEQQKEYCGGTEATEAGSDMYRRCSNWRAEKLVYYYKLMRKTYCQVDNWPNSPKIKKTYGEYLNLFGTFYAFQK